jgi:glycosyltransferase involved in cell wall biosynthesis
VSELVHGRVSVVVPVFQRESLLPRAVASALAQTHADVEVIVVDDGSADGTWACAQSLAARDPRVHALRQDNAGPGLARNLGLSAASGEFVQYLDSDDELQPRKFELQVAALRSHPEAGMAYGLTRRRSTATGVERDWARTGEDIADIFPSFLMKRGWDTNSPLWRRSTCDAIGPWGDFRCHEDWEHDLRAGLLGFRPARVAEHVATVHDHDEARASGMGEGFSAGFVHEMFRAHRSVWERMRAQACTDPAYLGAFARKLFWLARLCGAHGLYADADEALAIAQEMGQHANGGLQLRSFRALTRVLGWRRSVAASEGLRRGWRRLRGGANG